MPKLKGADELRQFGQLAQKEQSARAETGTRIIVGMGTCGIAAGAAETRKAIVEELERRNIDAYVGSVGCIGMCSKEPLVDIQRVGHPRVTYCNVNPDMVPRLIEEHVSKGAVVKEWVMGQLTYQKSQPHQIADFYSDLPFYSKQRRITLRNCGIIDPESIKEYIVRDGYEALAQVVSAMDPDDVVYEVKRSGLRGRGGAGFLTGIKWEFTARAPSKVKYVVCNADEGDPGAFMDRSVIEGDPHSLLEGMAICGYAIGAREGYIYCRAEYPLAIRRLRLAIAQAKEYGLLGDNILGSDFSFHLHIKEGAGAFVCGEETALLASIEGKRGEPRPRPPFPAVRGLWGKPTNLNNVKSYATVPQIIVNGADWFASIGTPRSPGTAIFALTGKIRNTGLVEVPMGIPLGEIIFDIGGGIPNGKAFKAVQTGGPLGGCIPAEHLNVPVDFDSLKDAGAVMGSGGMIVVDEDTCMVEFAKFFLTFATAESCGKCVPCRIGGQRMLDILTRISEGQGTLEDLDRLHEIAEGMQAGSLCALGQLTPGPVLSALRYFEDEFRAHIVDKYCPAGACKTLVRATCTNACPAEVDIPSYVALVAEGRYAEALEVHRRRNPFPLICGRVCPAFCEQTCRRGNVDEPIAIRSIKRFMADHEMNVPWTPPVLGETKREQVAIVGSGPAGLTAALRLAQRGYRVTVFEKLPLAGGMMTVGIPTHRLPRYVLRQEINNIRHSGVEIQCNQELGRDFTLDELLGDRGYSAVILALGAHKSRRLNLEGENLKGVMHGIDFLREVALGNVPDMTGQRIAIIGGGDGAMDSARTAWRLGASEVHVIYRRRREDMPAYVSEIEAAYQEGVTFHFLANPTRILERDGRVVGVECLKQTLGEFDASCRRRPIADEDAKFVIDVDILVPAIGEEPDQSWMEDPRVDIRRDGTFVVDEALGTTWKGVFAAGDAVIGPSTVVQAVAQGNQVAHNVDHYLRTGRVDKVPTLPGYEVIEQSFNMEDYADARRPEMPELSVEARKGSFHEVELGMDEETIQEECKRCLRCDLEWLESQGLACEPDLSVMSQRQSSSNRE